MYEDNFAFNNLQLLICHKTKPYQFKYIQYIYKEDLALYNMKWSMYHKTQLTQIIYI